jgi:hypothetical protein
MLSVEALIILLFVIAILLPIIASIWIYKDARKRKYEHPYVIAILALFFPIITLIVWLLCRPKPKKKVKK